MHKHMDTKLITSEKLTEFFRDHLKEKPVELQPEVINPELYPHIIVKSGQIRACFKIGSNCAPCFSIYGGESC